MDGPKGKLFRMNTWLVSQRVNKMDRNVVVQTTHFIQLSWVGGGTHRSMQHENILSFSNLR